MGSQCPCLPINVYGSPYVHLQSLGWLPFGLGSNSVICKLRDVFHDTECSNWGQVLLNIIQLILANTCIIISRPVTTWSRRRSSKVKLKRLLRRSVQPSKCCVPSERTMRIIVSRSKITFLKAKSQENGSLPRSLSSTALTSLWSVSRQSWWVEAIEG